MPSSPAGAPTWGTLNDAADHLRLSVRTVRRMVSRGEVDARRFGNQIRVDMTTIDGAGSSVVWQPAAGRFAS